jgi:hypothetical protein
MGFTAIGYTSREYILTALTHVLKHINNYTEKQDEEENNVVYTLTMLFNFVKFFLLKHAIVISLFIYREIIEIKYVYRDRVPRIEKPESSIVLKGLLWT